MTDKEIVQKLIDRDAVVTREFFFTSCRPLFLSIIRFVFSYKVDYDEFVNDFYLYLMENDAYRLRQFQGRSSIYQWMKIVAIRFFILKRDELIEDESKEGLLDNVAKTESVDYEKATAAKIDIESLFRQMPNKRYVYVIRRLVLQEAEPMEVAKELMTNVDNLYNIKKRAVRALTEIALKEIEKYEKVSK